MRPQATLVQSRLPLPLLRRGKVREVYEMIPFQPNQRHTQDLDIAVLTRFGGKSQLCRQRLQQF